jgi:putative endonuclease
VWLKLKSWWGQRRAQSAQTAAGAEGERRAADFLRTQRGYAIIARNWRDPRDRRDEIDLVCRDGDVLVFVEVKTRAAGALVSGYHAVGAKKKRVLRRVCTAYLRALRLDVRPRTFRFDVVEVSEGGGGAEVYHFENVPLFPKDLRW